MASAAYNKLALIELEQQPAKYIVSQPFVGKDDYLWIAVKNRTAHEVVGVRLRLLELVDSNTVGQTRTLRKQYRLAPGQQVEIRTDLGPFDDRRHANRFRSEVLAARPSII